MGFIADDNESTSTPAGFNITAAAVQGGRRYMEDRIHIEAVRDSFGNLKHLFAAVYDGHGGAHASEYVCQNLHDNIKNNKAFYSDDDEEVLSAIRQSFTKTHDSMQKMVEHWPMTSSGFPCTAGTTASVAIIRGGKLYTGHVGDSAIVLFDNISEPNDFCDVSLRTANATTVRKLTEDHKPDATKERNRIEALGGAVALKAGVSRVVWTRPIIGHNGPIRRSTSTEKIPFLAVARALGDFWSLNPSNNEYVVSPEPDVAVFEISTSNSFLVLASDGLTNVMKPRQMEEKLRHFAATGIKSKRCYFLTTNKSYPLNYAQFLLKEALDGWRFVRADNISVVCIQLIFQKALLNGGASESDSASSLFVSAPSFSSLSDLDSITNSEHRINNQSEIVIEEDPWMNIDKALSDYPCAMIQVTPTNTQICRTNVICIVYGRNALPKESFQGPGFVVPRSPALTYNSDLSEDDEDIFATNTTKTTRRVNVTISENAGNIGESIMHLEEEESTTKILANIGTVDFSADCTEESTDENVDLTRSQSRLDASEEKPVVQTFEHSVASDQATFHNRNASFEEDGDGSPTNNDLDLTVTESSECAWRNSPAPTIVTTSTSRTSSESVNVAGTTSTSTLLSPFTLLEMIRSTAPRNSDHNFETRRYSLFNNDIIESSSSNDAGASKNQFYNRRPVYHRFSLAGAGDLESKNADYDAYKFPSSPQKKTNGSAPSCSRKRPTRGFNDSPTHEGGDNGDGNTFKRIRLNELKAFDTIGISDGLRAHEKTLKSSPTVNNGPLPENVTTQTVPRQHSTILSRRSAETKTITDNSTSKVASNSIFSSGLSTSRPKQLTVSATQQPPKRGLWNFVSSMLKYISN